MDLASVGPGASSGAGPGRSPASFRIGSSEAGKRADLACVDLERLHSQPLYDVQSQLVYATRADQVTDVWIGGRHQLENARHVHIDTDTLLARANEWRARIARTRD